MKKINYIKFIIDLTMLITFTLFFNKMVLGMALHEIIGIAIGGVVLVHCGLNFKWIKAITVKLFNKGVKLRTRIIYILDVILLIDVLAIIISGISISKVLFSWLRLDWLPNLKGIHVFASYLILMIIGIHLGLHWKWVMNTFKKIFNIKEKKILTYIARALTIIVMIFGIYSFDSVGYLSKLSINSFNKEGMRPNMEFNKDSLEFNEDKSNPNDDIDTNNLSTNNAIKENSNDNTDMKRGNHENNNLGDKPSVEGNFNGKEGNRGNSSILSVLITYLSIIAIFSIITYYLDQIINKKE